MTTTFGQQPDYIPYRHTQEEYTNSLKNLSENDGPLYADRNGIQVWTTGDIAARVFGWAGRKDHTSIPNVKSGLAKFLYYGFVKGFIDPEVKKLILAVKEKHFSISAKPSFGLDMIITLVTSDLSRKAAIKQVKESLRNVFTDDFPGEIDPLGNKTPVPKGAKLEFGDTHIRLANEALQAKNYPEAVAQIINAANLKILRNQASVGSLLRQIAKSYPCKELDPVLAEYRNLALQESDYNLAYQYDRLFSRLTLINDPQKVINLARGALDAGNLTDASKYLKRPEFRDQEQFTQQRIDAYIQLSEQADDNNQPELALDSYQRAVNLDAPVENVRLGKLHFNMAEHLYGVESIRWTPNYSKTAENYTKAIENFGAERGYIENLFEDDLQWAEHFLTSLKQTKQLADGLEMIDEILKAKNKHIHEMKKVLRSDGIKFSERNKAVSNATAQALEISQLGAKFGSAYCKDYEDFLQGKLSKNK